MIPGGDGGGNGFNAVANLLAGQYTVVTYDRRGAYRSTLDDTAQDVRLEMHSDDAHHLLAALTTEPAYIFGSSAGALIGLDLAIRYPAQVRMLVTHEPPVEGLLPDFDQFQADLLETYRQEGGLAALRKFMTQLGVNYAQREPGVELPPSSTESATKRGDALIAYTFMAVHRYQLDLAALATTPARVVLAAGSAGQSSLGYRCASAVAERLGTTLVEFPSHHAGYMSHPQTFAEKLRDVLGDEPGT
ncbi:MAG: alpha/beta hydrolase [Chloroflexi bacterium]|nr:alpha/beta hydrolase [Chloroflexota bacterium]